MWTDPVNRYLNHWQRADGLVLATAVVLTAAIGFAASIRLSGCGSRARRAGGIIVYSILVEVALAQMVRAGDESVWWVNWVLPVIVYAGAGIALLAAPGRMVRAAGTVTLVLSPLGIIMLAQLLLWPPIDVRGRVASTEPKPSLPVPGPVLVILFDDWSFERSVDSMGGFLSSLVNLRTLAGYSYVFSRAAAAAPRTLYSIPQMIYQWPSDPFVRPGIPWWMDYNAKARTPHRNGMFARGSQRGYTVRIFGFYLPYRALVGEAATDVHAEPYWPKHETFAKNVAWAFARNIETLGNPLVRAIGRKIFDEEYKRFWYDMNHRLEAGVSARLGAMQSTDYVFAHMVPPHSPFVFAADGSFKPDQSEARTEAHPEKYSVQLHYADKMLGGMLDDLRASGQFDNTLIIVTSDHGWKEEPDPVMRARARATHVPLIIKWPGQTSGVRVHERTCLVGIQVILDQYFAGMRMPSSGESRSLSRQSCGKPAESPMPQSPDLHH